MKVFLLTQPDAFYIPKLLDKFLHAKPKDVQVVGASVLKGEIAVQNVGDYLRLLGIRGTLVNGFEFLRYAALDVVDKFVGLSGIYSVPGVLRKHGIPEHTPQDINDSKFHAFLRDRGVDLIISVACPQIVRDDLLQLPPKGIINIHGALLPKYRGKLPSFWVLAKGESKTGVTVHYMNAELDDGPIIVQKEVPIRKEDTLHSLIMRSKVQYGASALAEAVHQIKTGNVKTRKNPKSEATYFSFPSRQEIKAFKENNQIR